MIDIDFEAIRNRKPKFKDKGLSMRIEKDKLFKLTKIAKENDVSKSDILAELIDVFLDTQEKKISN